jgi:ubiquinone/menaquinone biosynthesis C-methylase UbiE
LNFQDEHSKYKHAYALPDKNGRMQYGMNDHSKRFRFVRERFIDTIPSGSTFLDVSCGRGETLVYAASRGLRPTGTEMVPELVENPRHTYPMVSAVLPDLPLRDEQFEYVMNTDVLEHLEPAEILPSIDNLVRVASKEAFFFTNSRSAIRFGGEWSPGKYDVVHLHISRFPMNYWMEACDMVAQKYGCRVEARTQRDWRYSFRFYKNEPYDPSWNRKRRADQSFNYFWLDKRFPINQIPGYDQISDRTLTSDWWEPFCADVAEKGIRQPVLLHRWFHPAHNQKQDEYWIRDGNHRVAAMHLAGHKTIPAVIFGMHCAGYPDWKRNPVHFEEAQNYFKEGQMEWASEAWAPGIQLPRMTGVSKPAEEFGSDRQDIEYESERDD